MVGQPKEKRENKLISRAENREHGFPTLGKRENEWISRGYNRGLGRLTYGKKEKTNALVGDKNRGRGGQP